jgi:PAS domain S-box-containing protein
MPPKAKFGDLLESIPDALMGVDTSGVIKFINSHAEALFGYGHDELLGALVETLVPDRLRPVHAAHRAAFASARATRPMGTDLMLVGQRRDGTEFPVDIALSAMQTGEGVLVIASVRDMTERLRVELNRGQLERLAAIVEHCDDAIISSTLDGIITSWNRAAERLYGYTGEEIIGRSTDLLSPQDQLADTRTILEKIRAGKHVEHRHTTRVRKDGSLVRVSLTASPIRDASGAIIGASRIVRDLSRQEETCELFASMIEASQDCMVSISAQGKITDVNEATVKLTGVPRDQLIGTSFSSYFTDPEKAEAGYQKVFEQGSVTDYPLSLRHSDDPKVLTEVLYNASLYRDTAGTVLGVFATARDITKQVHAQREIAHQQALEIDRLADLERFQRLTVGRELKMIELKQEIEHLKKLGRADGGEHGRQH